VVNVSLLSEVNDLAALLGSGRLGTGRFRGM
jgi:hypothetical protein